LTVGERLSKSVVDIIQASGRAMRRKDDNGKKFGYLLVPLVVTENMTFEDFAATPAFKTVARIITALSVVDDRIVEELRAIQNGRISKGKIIKFPGTVPVGLQMTLQAFAKNVSLKLWENVGPLNRRPFKEARAFARSLGFKSTREWFAYCTSGKKPGDIPSGADRFDANSGWISWPDWLGYDVERRPFVEARAFVRKLGLTGKDEWYAYCKSGKKPDDIPANPPPVYSADWISWPDWVGTKGIRPLGGWRSFAEARAFARSLGLKSKDEWGTYCKSGKRPDDIPNDPFKVYSADWVRWSDWLGTKFRKDGWRRFKEARAFVRKLELMSGTQWDTYCSSGKKPDDIPTWPSGVYAGFRMDQHGRLARLKAVSSC